MEWLRERGLTLVLGGLFLVFLAAQFATGLADYNEEQARRGAPPVEMSGYLRTGHAWEATFENWESEFLQMAAFVVFTTFLFQRGSAESRRPGVVELVDADPRDFAGLPSVPWPVRRGGWILRVYEHSLGLAFAVLFLLSWLGHAAGSWRDAVAEQVDAGGRPPGFAEHLTTSRLWFESFQNWQSEFLAIASMVWLSVYLRERGSPESKPVHASHDETGR
jgi:hypothetical protein